MFAPFRGEVYKQTTAMTVPTMIDRTAPSHLRSTAPFCAAGAKTFALFACTVSDPLEGALDTAAALDSTGALVGSGTAAADVTTGTMVVEETTTGRVERTFMISGAST